MKYGHIVLARRFGNLLSSLNVAITESYFSHSFSTIAAPSGRLLSLEAEAQGVTAGPFDIDYEQDASRDYIMYEINIPDSAKDAGLDTVINKLETGYGFLQMPWFIWRYICSKFGKDIKNQNNWFNSDGTLCSQLVVEYLKAAGLDLFGNYGQGSISPQDIYLIAKSNPEIFIEVKRKIRDPKNPRL